MNIYDKARWQIEGGMAPDIVVVHFKFMFQWLKEFHLLSDYGIKTLEDGIDDEAVLTDEMVNIGGKNFLDKYYDIYVSQIQYGVKEDAKLLENLYYKI